MGKPNWAKRLCAAFVLCAATTTALPAQTFTTLHSFDYTDGANPYAGLVQGTDGDLYGTTAGGGSTSCTFGCGTIFKITRSGTPTTLHSFCSQSGCADGEYPYYGALVQGTDGNLYGTTAYGGVNNHGTIFKITPGGMLTTLYSLGSQSGDAVNPYAGLVQSVDGNFYGTTPTGGASGSGTVFKVTPSGTLTTLYSFGSQSGDGINPYAGLVLGNDGNFYGATYFGGAYGNGSVFKINPSGTLTTLYSFGSQSGDGTNPYAKLVQGADGNFYGTTPYGGANAGGTAFKVTPGGTLTILYNFCSQSNCADGGDPRTGLFQATDGNFYGTTEGGGATRNGAVFKITPSGTQTVLYSFCSLTGCADGSISYGALVQAADGNLYGQTLAGGTSSACYGGCGTIFSLSVGLGPFVETLPTAGNVGRTVEILGTNLTGATNVSFSGVATGFTVVSSSLIKARVPVGASTGRVQVRTPSGALSSNVPFRVLP